MAGFSNTTPCPKGRLTTHWSSGFLAVACRDPLEEDLVEGGKHDRAAEAVAGDQVQVPVRPLIIDDFPFEPQQQLRDAALGDLFCRRFSLPVGGLGKWVQVDRQSSPTNVDANDFSGSTDWVLFGYLVNLAE